MAAGGQYGDNAVEIFELDGEKDLLRVLSEKEPTFAEVNEYLAKFRIACQNTVFHCFETRVQQNDEENKTLGTESASLQVEGRLWDMHVKINTRFRKLLSRFRDQSAQKKRPTENRKLQSHYLNFIKSSQRFYRGYIQHLVSRFNCIPELEKLAKELKFETLSAEDKPEIPEDLRNSVVLTCHATLIRLGDLSRYREMELVPPTKNRNWDCAIRYYKLADTLNPDSGMSHNQLAVIGLADGNHLQATYHLYRALSAREPYPTSNGNLEIEFRKVLAACAKGESIGSSEDGKATLISMFIYLHAQCYKGVDFPEHDELENEILSQMAVDLKELSLHPPLLQKFCLINIAAEDYANARWANREKDADGVQPARDARQFFQRLNVKTFFTLLQILLSELECSVAANESEKITPVAQIVLPALRQYSSWLLSNSGSLICEDKDTLLCVQIKEFWKMYASTLNLLTSSFDVPSLSDIGYLLHEDEDTLGFSPFVNDITWQRYVDESGQKKPRLGDLEEKLPVHIEMLFRVREFVIDGLDLVVQEKIPIILADSNETKLFVYKEEGLPQFSSPSGHQHRHTLSSTSVDREDIHPPESNPEPMEYANSQSASASISLAMNQMVDKLVESETNENCPPIERTLSSSTAWHNANIININTHNTASQQDGSGEHSSNGQCTATGTGTGTLNSYSPIIEPLPPQSYSPRPTLPSILNTPFAPQPGEAISPATRPSTAIRQGEQYHPNLYANNNRGFSQAQDFSRLQQYGIGFQNSLQAPSTPNDYSYPTRNLSPTQMQTPSISYNNDGGGGYATHNPPPGLPFNWPLNNATLQYKQRGPNQPGSPYYQYSSYNSVSSANSKASHLGAGVIGQTPPSGQGSGG
ncbi:EST1 superfamily domain-containing protein [Histoplasma capsulatum var. duboisii H88]|uniref:Nonsense-mediated mRNA decay factor n=2 Tax=Ajellomyces capsulatus TaxID=5037 RepID=A0A8A1LR58_AJEC8|nr:EST1 superfamily domain-containing protein [Histoplasma capsulatum var. duboisii H88]